MKSQSALLCPSPHSQLSGGLEQRRHPCSELSTAHTFVPWALHERQAAGSTRDRLLGGKDLSPLLSRLMFLVEIRPLWLQEWPLPPALYLTIGAPGKIILGVLVQAGSFGMGAKVQPMPHVPSGGPAGSAPTHSGIFLICSKESSGLAGVVLPDVGSACRHQHLVKLGHIFKQRVSYLLAGMWG